MMSLSKIVEKVVILQLTENLNVINVITSRQFGFRGGFQLITPYMLFSMIYMKHSQSIKLQLLSCWRLIRSNTEYY